MQATDTKMPHSPVHRHIRPNLLRLRRYGRKAGGVSLKIRFGQFQTISRSMTLAMPSDVTSELWQAARGVFEQWPFQPVRLIGVTAERLLRGAGQLELFTDPQRKRQRKLDGVADRINRIVRKCQSGRLDLNQRPSDPQATRNAR
jgi:DNA polymerase IV